MQAQDASTARQARFAVIVLTAMNLLNYFDRYVPSAVKDLFKEDLKLTDTETSLPLTAFVVVYMFASPVFGSLADRVPRKRLIAAGVGLWSLATAGAALATGFWSFLFARALVGVGEAAYATLAPVMLSDWFAPEKRNRVLTIFYVAIPVGAALGFSLGGVLGGAFGWRAAFLVCGLPGLLAAALALRIQDPRDTGQAYVDEPEGGQPSWGIALRALSKNGTYITAVIGYTLVTFASGGMADWLPTWLARERGNELVGVSLAAWDAMKVQDPAQFHAATSSALAKAGGLVGMVTIMGGLGGTVLGGWLADRWANRFRNPYLATSAITMAPAAVFAVLAFNAPSADLSIVFIGLAQVCMWCYNGPINTVLVNSTDPWLRARAFSLSILSIHILGDAISPPIIGAISDATGSLTWGVALVPLTLALGAGVWAWGWKRL